MSFASAEIAVLADCVIQAIHDQPTSRLLGQALTAQVLEPSTIIFRRVASLPGGCAVSHRNTETLFAKWTQLCQSMEASLAERGRAAWAQALLLEDSSAGDTKQQTSQPSFASLPFSSDAERTVLRQMPRPAKGCRCRGKDHEYLHDVRCTLYRDISRLIPPEELKDLQYDPNVVASGKNNNNKELKVVETAFKDRLVKIKTAAELEETEARFVSRMEEVQVQEMHKAVFAPNLASMVLSSIFELQREFPVTIEEREAMELDDEDNYDDEGNNVAGKRKSSGLASKDSPSKRSKTSKSVKNLNFRYLMRIVQHIGKTWGHVYREPSHEDYAWRWELFHGHNSEGAKWESQSTNPRQPNALSFEHVRHAAVLDKKATSKLSAASQAIATFEDALQSEWLQQVVMAKTSDADKAASLKDEVDASSKTTTEAASTSDPQVASPTGATTAAASSAPTASQQVTKIDIDDETVEQLCVAAHLLSPASSGLYDELLALVQMGLLDISRSGIPVLASDWATKVDYVVLEDMEVAWGSAVDPEGRFGVHLELRDTLEEEWLRTNRGWALASDPDDVIFDVDELEEWRDFFQGQIEKEAQISEGIGRFGL